MATPFIAEVRMFAFSFAPRDWALCNGQIFAIAQNQALFALLGTTYGGNGQTTFALPNLQGNVAMHFGNGNGTQYNLGEKSGEYDHTLTMQEIPPHMHTVGATTADADSGDPAGRSFAKAPNAIYTQNTSSLVAMNPGVISPVGSSIPHSNVMPYLVINFCICVAGFFPSRN